MAHFGEKKALSRKSQQLGGGQPINEKSEKNLRAAVMRIVMGTRYTKPPREENGMVSIDQYECLEVSGSDNMLIPIGKRTRENEGDGPSGTRLPDWMVDSEKVTGSTLRPGPLVACIELFGFYCE